MENEKARKIFDMLIEKLRDSKFNKKVLCDMVFDSIWYSNDWDDIKLERNSSNKKLFYKMVEEGYDKAFSNKLNI